MKVVHCEKSTLAKDSSFENKIFVLGQLYYIGIKGKFLAQWATYFSFPVFKIDILPPALGRAHSCF